MLVADSAVAAAEMLSNRFEDLEDDWDEEQSSLPSHITPLNIALA